MTKGIREAAEKTFAKTLPKAGVLGATEFRRKVMNTLMETFDISIASAATAYNFVLKKWREENPKAVAGIGRDYQPTIGGGATAVASKRGSDIVTVVQANNEAVVAELPRALALDLIESQKGKRGRGHPRLMIQEEATA